MQITRIDGGTILLLRCSSEESAKEKDFEKEFDYIIFMICHALQRLRFSPSTPFSFLSLLSKFFPDLL